MRKKIHIVGAGIGSLSLAIRLQSKGYDVEIFEKNSSLGGHAQQFELNGYRFDMGPTLITAPDIIQKLYFCANKNMFDELELISLDPFYRVFFSDGTKIDYTSNSDMMKSQIEKFNFADSIQYDKFIKTSKRIYQSVIEDGLGSEPFDSILSMLKFIPKAYNIGALDTSYRLATRYFKDFRTRFIFSFHPLFIGGNPFSVPSIYSMISYLEKKGGIWYAKGGMKSLVNSLSNIFQELGGKLHTSSLVEKIIVENSIAKGIIIEGRFIPADAVASNADVSHTYLDLIDRNIKKRWNEDKLNRAKYSMSAFLLYIGVKKKYDKLLHHNIILSHRYKGLLEDIFKHKVLPEDFSMYVYIPSKTEPTMAPANSDSMYILVPVANLKSNINWTEAKRMFANKIINFLEAEFDLVNFRENIEFEVIYTPDDFKNERNCYHGTPWGLEPVLLQSAYFRTQNKSESISNLFLVGAGTHPGAGLPGVMLSAELTEKQIRKFI